MRMVLFPVRLQVHVRSVGGAGRVSGTGAILDVTDRAFGRHPK
jgi:hypothetical protein